MTIHWTVVKCSIQCLTDPHTSYGSAESYNSMEGNFKYVHTNHKYISLLAHHVLQWFFRGLRSNAKAFVAMVNIEIRLHAQLKRVGWHKTSLFSCKKNEFFCDMA